MTILVECKITRVHFINVEFHSTGGGGCKEGGILTVPGDLEGRGGAALGAGAGAGADGRSHVV